MLDLSDGVVGEELKDSKLEVLRTSTKFHYAGRFTMSGWGKVPLLEPPAPKM